MKPSQQQYCKNSTIKIYIKNTQIGKWEANGCVYWGRKMDTGKENGLERLYARNPIII